jgi:hypothetical protein
MFFTIVNDFHVVGPDSIILKPCGNLEDNCVFSATQCFRRASYHRLRLANGRV